MGSVLSICVSYCSTPRPGSREITVVLPLDVPQRHPNLCHSTSSLSLSFSLSLFLSVFIIYPSLSPKTQLTYSSRWFSVRSRGMRFAKTLSDISSVRQFPHGQIYDSQRKEQKDKELSLLAKLCPTQQIRTSWPWFLMGGERCQRMLRDDSFVLWECRWIEL